LGWKKKRKRKRTGEEEEDWKKSGWASESYETCVTYQTNEVIGREKSETRVRRKVRWVLA
jgi:hypothetical protein